jgi:DNA polymerase-3 subunit epsilon
VSIDDSAVIAFDLTPHLGLRKGAEENRVTPVAVAGVRGLEPRLMPCCRRHIIESVQERGSGAANANSNAPGGSDEWVVIDFETASARCTPCQVAAIRVREGEEIALLSTLIYQHVDEFDAFNVALHGIEPEMVRDAPTWPVVRERLLEFSAGAPLVAHNAPFDIGVLRDASDVYEIGWPPVRYTCTLGIARQVWPGRKTYSLSALCHSLQIDIDGRAHDALHDARLAALLLGRAMEQREAPSLAELLDGLRMRLGEVTRDGWHGSTVRQLRARDVLESVSAKPDFDSPFFGKTVVFTGEMAMVRRIAWQLVAEVGGIPADSVTKKTDFLVCGYQDLMKLAHGETKSGKLRRAERLQAEGQPLEFLTEKDFFQLLQAGNGS